MNSTSVNRYTTLLREIKEHADRHGMPPPKLITVSKSHPWDEVSPVYLAGCRDFGENRVEEALEKQQASAAHELNWHFIGHLQRKKVSKVVGRFALIHSVDSLPLAEKISKTGVRTNILLEVNTSGEESKHGFTPQGLLDSFEQLKKLPHLEIDGLMTMAPYTQDQEIIRSCFRNLRSLRDRLGLKELSIGMSNDWRVAIEEGATLLRIGSSILEV